MQVPPAAHRPGRATLRYLLLVAVLMGFGVGGADSVEARVDGQAEATVSLVAVVTLVVLARRARPEARARGAAPPRRKLVAPRRLLTAPAVATSTRGHPRSRRGPPWGASHPSTCA